LGFLGLGGSSGFFLGLPLFRPITGADDADDSTGGNKDGLTFGLLAAAARAVATAAAALAWAVSDAALAAATAMLALD
jgi:hypothetical protein